MSRQPTRVLVVDDSAVVRGLVARALETDETIVVAGTAMHGQAALQWLRGNTADVVILDVEMPVMDGLTALKAIHAEFPRVQVVMASTLTYEGAETTVRALALGAADCIRKPAARSTAESIEQIVDKLVPLVKALGRSSPPPRVPEAPGRGEPGGPVAGSPPAAAGPDARPAFRKGATAREPASHPQAPVQAIVVGASTGGPRALSLVVSALPRDFAVPILLVQHMPPVFTPMLAEHLARDSGRVCREAVDGGPIEAGHIYVAPGDYHLLVGKRNGRMVTRLNQAPPEHYCRPSVNPLFRSAAEWYGKSALAVMLTGMGEDGLEGAREIAERGGYVIAQDERTSVVWGMPAAVVREGLAQQVVPVQEVAPMIHQLCTAEACRA